MFPLKHKVQEESEAHENVSLLHAGVERLPEHERVQSRSELLGEGHDDVQVSFHRQVQVRLQAPQRPKRLLPFLPVKRRRGGGEAL